MKALAGLWVQGLFLCLLAACGGGGGGGGSSLSLTMPQTPLKASMLPNQLPVEVITEATAQGTVSAPVIYVLISDERGTFAPGEVWFGTYDGERYEVRLKTASNLGVGVHSGVLLVRVCPDNACKTVLTSATRPYEITVKPPSLEGIPEPLQSAALQGDAVQFYVRLKNARKGMPVYLSARGAPGIFSAAATPMEPLRDSFDEYHAKLPLAAGIAARRHAGEVTLNFCNDAQCNSPYMTHVMPYQIQVLARLEGIDSAVSGLALDKDQNLYAATDERILKVTPSGVVSTWFDRTASSQNPSPPSPRVVAVDSSGAVYYSDFQSSVYKVTSGSTASYAFGVSARGMAFDKTGNLYATYNGNEGRALQFTSAGELVENWGAEFTLDDPVGIVVDNARIAYIADERGIVRVAPDRSSSFFGSVPALQHWGERTWGIALGSSDSLLVTTVGGVFQISQSGAAETIVAPRSLLASRGGERFYPGAIARTPGGRVYLSDGVNKMVVYTQVP